MALAEVVASAAPDAPHNTGEQLRTLGSGFNSEMPQERHVPKDKVGDRGQTKKLDGAADPGYNIPVLASYDGGMVFYSRNVYSGIIAENGYYTPGYDFSHQSAYCPQPQGAYVSSLGTGASGYGGPHCGTYYQPSLIQYYSTEQEGSKPLSSSKDASQNAKGKPGVQGKPGYQVGYISSPAPETPSQWVFYPAAANGGFYGSAMSYECYSQQWTSSQRGFQPLPAPQNLGVPGNCVPPSPGNGPGCYPDPKVLSAPNMTARDLKGCTMQGGSAVSNWKAKEVTKIPSKGEGVANGVFSDTCTEQTKRLSVVKPKLLPAAVQECGDVFNQPLTILIKQSISVNRIDYNKENFQISYEAAKFFIIKSYSEDDVHKSIKYGVWSSTPNGNKRLDEAYRKAQEKSDSLSTSCPIFFFFSVNSSGQFCGLAEMVGHVDFGKNMDFWLQGKWNGCLPVKWHIIKDVPNGHFRHIILANNDSKPVTHSRDTQEVHFHQGLEMLKIFKFFPTRTSLLDDFGFYDGRQRVLQERKSKQQLRQQVVKQIKEIAVEKTMCASYAPSDDGKENGRPAKQAEKTGTEVDVSSHQVKDSGRLTDAVEAAKARNESVLLEVTELKLADLNRAAEKCDEEKHQDLENLSRVEEQNICKPNGSETHTVAAGKETSSKPRLVEKVGHDKSSKQKGSKSRETLTSPAKKDVSRIVINYKKALLEGTPGKVIVLDQSIGA